MKRKREAKRERMWDGRGKERGVEGEKVRVKEEEIDGEERKWEIKREKVKRDRENEGERMERENTR